MSAVPTFNHSTNPDFSNNEHNLLTEQEAREQMRRYFRYLTHGSAAEERIGIFSITGEEFRSFRRDKLDEAISYVLDKQYELLGRGALTGIYAQQGMSTVVPTNGKRWKSADISSMGALFLDVDYGTVGHTKTLPPTLDAALEIVNTFSLKPSMIVHSGGGIYPYFLLDERISGEDFKPINARLIDAFSRIQVAKGYAKCDAVIDATRVLRVAGTINGKGGLQRQAFILSENLTLNGFIRRYTLGDIETAIADIEAQYPAVSPVAADPNNKIVPFPATDASAAQATALDDETIVRLLTHEKTDIGRKLYSADVEHITKVYGGDWSGAEQALVNKIVFYTRDVAQIDRIWVNSPLGQRVGCPDIEKVDKTISRDASYRSPTIAKALLLVTKRYTPRKSSENGIPEINVSDTGNADRFIELMQDKACWGAEDKQWYVLDQHAVIWEKSSDTAAAHIRTVVTDLKRDLATLKRAINEADDEATRERAEVAYKSLLKWVTTCQSGSHPEVMLKQARSAMMLKRDMFDHDQMAVATLTKRLDLTKGKVRDRMPEDYFTHHLSVEFHEALMQETALASTAPNWYRFLMDIFNGDAALIDYIQRALGYSMTGDVKEQKMFVLYGKGSNGKSTLMEVIKEVLGGYAHMVNSDVLSVRSYRGGASPDLAKLKGVRMAIASESDETAVFDEARVKVLTGGDTVNARPLYGAPINFKPTHKIWLTTNHRPEVNGTDNGIWRRLVLVPMNVAFGQNLKAEKIMDRDPEMKQKLLAESEGILAWLVTGCLKWQQRGLDVDVPQVILDATRNWREEADTIAQFIEDTFVLDPKGVVRVEDVNEAYNRWSERNMLDAKSEKGKTKSLKARLEEKGIKQDRGAKGVRIYRGLRYMSETEINERDEAMRAVRGESNAPWDARYDQD